ncbi:methylated-DNA--protein-cysteine methyltransferase [Bordetella trematum]|uniref:methylated-DNA--[protein]-cysteine S-methyltransferase n=1 Tax=Bordetella trematum TaxID=123899 RepID=UPI00079C76ED|nr:methylated-DNA--[protein]-cysteine S-methyltransferase [Bordetella trematum]CZZ91694.1 methylated-DNA--protein-cysteine methyltransferase [Bordetella trematum]
MLGRQRHHLDTPLGAVLLVSDAQQRLHALEFLDAPARRPSLVGWLALPDAAVPAALAQALAAYFAGRLDALQALVPHLAGSDWQQTVWRAVSRIPPGQTRSYGALGAQLGRHPRAVGNANAANPIGLVVPCHRLVGHDGGLAGYAWGVARKAWLLRHEGVPGIQSQAAECAGPTGTVKCSHPDPHASAP